MPVEGERAGHGGLGSTVDEFPLASAGRRPVLPEDRPGHAGIRAMADAVSGGLRRQATVQIDA